MHSINDTLPTELLFHIFHCLDVVDGPLGLSGALFVCRLWSAIILNDSHLWTNLVFNQVLIQQLVPSPARLLNYIERCGALSGDHFIHMSVDIAAFNDYLQLGETGAQQPDQQRLASQFSLLTIARAMARAGSFRGRIRTLVFSGGHAPASPLRIITSVMIDLVQERLQHLELRRCRDNAIGSIASLPKSLETVLLLDPDWGTPSFSNNGLISARQLTFQRESFWCCEDLRHLGYYQSLTELRLIWSPTTIDDPSFVIGTFENWTMEGYTRQSLLLPSVTTLYLRGDIPFLILDPLNLPALNKIEVQNQDSLQPLLNVHSTTLHNSITKLAVLFTSDTSDGWRDALASVLAGASNLQTLVVSRWMERYLSVSEGVAIELV